MKQERGLFIVFEGIDGSGKSTQVENLHRFMIQHYGNTIVTSEPSKRQIGRLIRDIFARRIEMDNLTIAGLFVADRLDHITNKEEGILQYLESGTHVICDRYILSSFAYQGVFADKEWIVTANSQARKLLLPDITFYLDITPEESMNRIHIRKDASEIYENLEIQKKVYMNYEEGIQKYKVEDHICRIDASQNKEKIFSLIEYELKTKFSRLV